MKEIRERRKVTVLSTLCMIKDEKLEQLRQDNTALLDQVARLSERIRVLEAQLAKDIHISTSVLKKSSFNCAMRLKDVGLDSSRFVSRNATETSMPL